MKEQFEGLMNNGISIEEIYNTEEMKLARTHVNYSIPTIFLVNREAEQRRIFRDIWALGSVEMDETGQIQYSGTIGKNGYLDVVLGLPNANKYTTIINRISMKRGARIVDTEQVKREIIEFNNGWGSAVVHEEARYIADMVFEKALAEKQNIVLSKVGDNAYSILNKYISKAKEQGYIVNVHYVELNREEALLRAIMDLIENAVFLPPDLIERFLPQGKASHIKQTYEQLLMSGMLDGCTMWKDSSVYADSPCLLELEGTENDWIEDGKNG